MKINAVPAVVIGSGLALTLYTCDINCIHTLYEYVLFGALSDYLLSASTI